MDGLGWVWMDVIQVGWIIKHLTVQKINIVYPKPLGWVGGILYAVYGKVLKQNHGWLP